MNDLITTERRSRRTRSSMTVDELLRSNIESARTQLGAARANLIEARRRVVALEGAVENWIEMAQLSAQRV
jgi:hypothetical protein